MIISLNWLIWTSLSLIIILLTRNPFYILGSIITLFILGKTFSKKNEQSNWGKQSILFLITVVTLSALINVTFAHTGQTILFTFPVNWLLIGGNITLESLLYGFVNGLTISALFLEFNVLNMGMSIKQMTRLIPNAFRPISTMITISLTFFPSIKKKSQEIREAQMIRGYEMKKLSDWIPILIPLIISSLENAFILAESMTARGFHTKASSKISSLNLVGLVSSVFVIFAGWIFQLYDYPPFISIILYGLGSIGFVLILWFSSKQNQTTHFHQEIWRGRDIIFTGFCIINAGLLIVLTMTGHLHSFSYSPYPRLTIPEISTIGIILSTFPNLLLIFFSYDKTK